MVTPAALIPLLSDTTKKLKRQRGGTEKLEINYNEK
jgi:hypothetical protein